VHATPAAPKASMDDLAFQDLGGMRLDRYHAPETVACIRSSKGCYWGECTFCDTYHGQRDDEMSIDRLVEEVRHLRDSFGVRHLEFVDQCISPERLWKLSDAFVRAELGVRWFCNARTETGFSRALFDRMAQAGATKVMWGIESGSPRLLKLMRKGVHPEARMSILRDAAGAGLWSFAFVFFGFPTETEAEAQQTIDLICEHTDVLHAYGRSFFTLGKHSPLRTQLERLEVTAEGGEADDFSKDLRVRLGRGLQGEALRRVGQRCAAQALRAYGGDPLWMALRSREALHLYVARHGRDWVRGYRLGRARAQAAAIEEQQSFVF
jgi:anaerobic magnesium-protoporphyrin IX monomethyl ester cyclase